MTEETKLEKMIRYQVEDGDILVLVIPEGLRKDERDLLGREMVRIASHIREQQKKEISTIVLPHGFDMKVISTKTSAPAQDLGEAYTVQVAALEFAKEWEHESSSAYRAAEAAFIAGYEFKVAQPVAARCQDCDGHNCDDGCAYPDHKRFSKEPPKTGLRIGAYLLQKFYTEGKSIRRACWPTGDHISTDSAEGGTLWYYSADEDELTKDYKLDFHDLAASDWEIIDEGTILR